MTDSNATIKKVIIALLFASALGAAILLVMPWIRTLYDPAVRESFTSFVDSLGVPGYLLMLGVQAAQVIIAIIPGEPVEIMAGALYGGFGGMILCLTGSALASAAVFSIMRRLGPRILNRIFRKKHLEEYAFMRDSRKLEVVTLLLFLTPATPKDMLTYVAGTTPMPLSRFIIITTFARIPSVVSSTYIGDSVLSGDWYVAAFIMLGMMALGVAGIFLREPIMRFCRRHSRRRSKAQ